MFDILSTCHWYSVRQIHETTFDVRIVTVYAVNEWYAESEANKGGWHATKVEWLQGSADEKCLDGKCDTCRPVAC